MSGTEASLYPPIGRFLTRRGYRVGYQVRPRPGSPRTFDVVGVHPRSRRTVAVEAKLGHFQRTIDQALLRRFVADLVYVSFPAPYARRVAREHRSVLGSSGLGLLGVTESRVTELLPARQSRAVSPPRRTQLIEMTMGLLRHDE